MVDRDDSEGNPIRKEPFPLRNVKDEFRGFRVLPLVDGLEPADGDLELDFLGNGRVSSGF